MKHILFFILFIYFYFGINTSLFAQVLKDHCVIDIETSVVKKDANRYVVGDIYFTPGTFTKRIKAKSVFGAMEILMDVNEEYFYLSNEQEKFSWQPADPSWDIVYESLARVYKLAGAWYMQISYKNFYDDDAENDEDDTYAYNLPCYMKVQSRVHWGTFQWQLKEDIKASSLRIKIRDYKDSDKVPSGGSDTGDNDIVFDFEGKDIVYEGLTPFLVVTLDDPFETLDPPTDLAGNTLICGTPLAEEYTVTVPASVDSCRWYVSSDEAGNTPVGTDVASIV
ncbi:MAG: hypothetical protein K2M86_00055, partial [Odoribacter sp.]|nr:hypothetical protein [Odoribacter sp.]